MSFRHDGTSAEGAAEAHAERRIRLASGVSLACIERGPSSGQALVLLHGLSDSCRSFEPLLAELPASLRVVVPSLRGHGSSDHPEHGYEVADFARDVRELLDALALDSAVVAGHSLGGNVALRLALDHPERVRGIALLAAFARFRNSPAVAELSAAIAALSDPVDGMFIRDFQRATLASPVAPAFFEQVVAESRRVPARVWQAIVASLLGPSGEPRFLQVRVPTLLLSGARDAFVPRADQQRFLAAIPGCRWCEYPGGHGFHWEDPAPVAQDLAAFVQACAAERGGAAHRHARL